MYTSFEIANPNTKEKSHTFMLFGGDFYSKRLTVARLHIFSAQVALLEIKPWLAESYSAMKSTTWWSASSENTLQLPSVCIFKSSGPSRKRTLDCRPSQFYGLLINTHILYTKHKIIHSFTHCFKLHGLKQFKNNTASHAHTHTLKSDGWTEEADGGRAAVREECVCERDAGVVIMLSPSLEACSSG